jgi:hypothetical protein
VVGLEDQGALPGPSGRLRRRQSGQSCSHHDHIGVCCHTHLTPTEGGL